MVPIDRAWQKQNIRLPHELVTENLDIVLKQPRKTDCAGARPVPLEKSGIISKESIYKLKVALDNPQVSLDQLLALRHSNGRPVVQLYGPANLERRGGTVQVNFFDQHGHLIDCTEVERLANEQRISLRAGCHCNPGAREVALNFTKEDLIVCFRDKDRLTFDQFLHVIDGKTTGALRASIGLATNFADVYKYVQFAKGFIDR